MAHMRLSVLIQHRHSPVSNQAMHASFDVCCGT